MTKGIDCKIAEKIKAHQHFLITSHKRPDADAVGSVLGLGLALIKAGKSVQMVMKDSVESYRYLPGLELITTKPGRKAEFTIVVDCSDLERTGNILEGYGPPSLVVDHHKTNLTFGQINVVEPQQAATTAILFDHLPSWGLQIDEEIATCLLAGIIGDTIGFRTSSVNAQLMHKAAALMDLGGDLSRIYNEELVMRSFAATRYWGKGLNRIECENGLVWTSLTLEDRRKVGYIKDDDANLVNVLSAVREANIAIIFIEQENGKVKVSWRTRPGFDVSDIAFHFGGGGHAAAAGADINGQLAEVKSLVIKKTLALVNSIDNKEID